MSEHDLEKIASAVYKYSANIKDSGFSAKHLAENPKKLAGFQTPGTPAFLMYDHQLKIKKHTSVDIEYHFQSDEGWY